MKAQSLIITGLLFLFIGSLRSQNVFQKTYGGTAADAGEGIKATSDLGFIVAGNTRSFGTGGAPETQDFMVIKANLLGTLTWTRELGTSNKRQDAKAVVLASDGGYIIGGRTHDATDNFNDDWLIKKYTAGGGSQIERVFGKNFSSPGIGANTDDELWSMKETAAQVVGMCGFSMNNRNPNKKDMSFVVYNLNDSTQTFARHIAMDSTLGGADVGRDFIVNLTATTTYTLLGGSTTMVGGNGQDFVIAHLNFPFANLSTYRSWGGTGSDEPTSLIKTSDGGYMMVGFSNSPGTNGGNDMLAIKLTSTFALSWAKFIGGSGTELAFQVKQTADDGYVIIGQTDSYGFGSTDMMVVKLTSAGALSWAKCYGGGGADDGRYMDVRSDGGFFFSGSCNEPISPVGNGQDLYVVATNSTGYSGGCNEMSITPGVTNPSVAFTSSATGLNQTTALMPIINQPMVKTSTAATLTCKCENYSPNLEIAGAIQVCHNTTGIYTINKVPGYTLYNWTLTGATFVTPPAPGDTSVNLNFTNTNAQLIVATNNGGVNCDFRIDTINISVDNIATAITTPDSLLCVGQGTALTANTVNNQGALSWVWQPSGPNNAINNVIPGSTQTYTVTVTDAWLCTASDQITVQVFPYPVVNLGPNDTVCTGGPVLLNATTAMATYLWSTSAATPTINAATTGTYWVDVTTNGCTTRDSIILGISVAPTITITGDDSLCIGQGTTLTANPSGGSPSYTFLWAGGLGTSNTISPTPLVTTTYTVTVTEGLGCTNTATKLVNVFPYPIPNLGPDDTVCTGGPVLLDATIAGATYNWSTTANTATINAITSGTYWVDVTTNGCTRRDSIVLGISTSPTISITGDDSLCVGQSTTLTANPSGGSPSYSFLWSGGLGTTNTISPTPPTTTTYTVMVTEGYGCTNTATKLVNVFSYPVVALGPDSGICNGVVPFVTLDAQNAGSNFTWSTSAGTQTINVNTSGTYWVDVMLNGCSTRDSIMVTFSTSPIAGYTGNLVICNGQVTTIVGNASGGTSPYTYTWSLGPTVSDSISLSPALTTNYNVIASDLGGCKDTAFFTVTVNQYPVVDIGPDSTGCLNTPVTLFAPATTGTILWSTGASTSSISVPGNSTIWLDITENGCTTRDSALISYYPIPVVNLGNDSVICAIGNVLLDATNIFSTYLWSTSATTPTINVTQTGLYSVQVSSCGIDYFDSVTVVMDTFSVFVLNVVPNDCGSSNGSLLVGDNSVYPTTYQWTSGSSSTSASLTNISDGTYIVDVTDSVGCRQTDTVVVVCDIPSIVITQLLTPNGDGKNDTWIIQGINNFPNARVTVFNRWGNEVYASVPYTNNWDGKSNSGISLGNDYLPAGTYFYTVDVYGDGSDIKSGYLEFQP